MVVDRLEQGDFERVPRVEDSKRTIAESTGPISAHMCKRSHEVTRAWTSDATLFRDKVEVADSLHQAWIGFLLRRDEQGPISGVSNVLEEVDRWKDAADDPYRARPVDLCDRDRLYRSPSAPLGVEIAADAHQVSEFTAKHNLKGRPICECEV